ncbi:MAG: flippase-like domain-containing protein [Clostridia bacterium]|nr:flippase-like domain-containing protein [Clostridia bacterium]
MLKGKKRWIIIFVIIAVLTVWTVISQSKSFSFVALQRDLENIRVPWLIMAVISMMGFIVFEGLAFTYIIKGITGRSTYHEGQVYSAGDIYFSAITPSASGGQLISAYFMIWDGIPAAQTTVILLLNLIMYTFALLFYGAAVLLFNFPVIFAFSTAGQVLIGVGIAILVGLAAFFALLLRKERIIHAAGEFIVDTLGKLHILHYPQMTKRRLRAVMRQYKKCVLIVRGKSKMLAWAFAMNLCQRLSQSLVVIFSYFALDGTVSRIFDVWSVQILTFIGSNSIPIPGAMGVADYLLIDGLEGLDIISHEANLELVSRGLSFYLCVIISMIITAAGYLFRRLKDRRAQTSGEGSDF